MNKSSNVMGKNLQKEIAEVKDEVSNSEFILKAKTQRIKELKIQLNNLNNTYEYINSKLIENKSTYKITAIQHKNNISSDSAFLSNNNFNSNITSTKSLNPNTLREYEKDQSMELNFLNKNNNSSRKSQNKYNYSNYNVNNTIKINNNSYNSNNLNNSQNLEKEQSNLICNISNFSDCSNLNLTINNDKNDKNEKESYSQQYWDRRTLLPTKSKALAGMSLQEVLDESENCLKIKSEIEISIKKLSKSIKENVAQMEKLFAQCEQGEKAYKKLESEYGFLKTENLQSEKKYKTILNFLASHEIFIKKFESEMMILKNKIELNKSVYSMLEKDLILKLYFVRFSNSMVRSLFNIINIRRLHIEMLKLFKKKEMESYASMFKKLDETELKILREYDDFLNYVKKEDC